MIHVKRLMMFKVFATSKWVYFCINVHSDITTLRKYIPTGIKIKFDFQRNDDKFSLLSHDKTTDFIIELGEMKMSCKRYKQLVSCNYLRDMIYYAAVSLPVWEIPSPGNQYSTNISTHNSGQD